MKIVEETERNKLGTPKRSGAGDGPDKALPRKIIDFESGRKAMEKARLEKEQGCARLVERSRLPGKLPHDRFEFLLPIILLFGLMFGVFVGLIGSWRF